VIPRKFWVLAVVVQALVLVPKDKVWLPLGSTILFQRTASAPGAVQVIGFPVPPPEVKISPEFPAVVGKLKL
jgi:hypothetical protein